MGRLAAGRHAAVDNQTLHGSQRCFLSWLAASVLTGSLHIFREQDLLLINCFFEAPRCFIFQCLFTFLLPPLQPNPYIHSSSLPVLRGNRGSTPISFLPPLNASVHCHVSCLTLHLIGSLPPPELTLWACEMYSHTGSHVQISPLDCFNALLLPS